MRLILVILATFVCFICNQAEAVTLTKFRVSLSDDVKNQNFWVFSNRSVDEECVVSFEHHTFDDKGNRSVDSTENPSYSALPFIRYSPRKFIVTPGNKQAIQFIKKRKIGVKDGEYNSVLSLLCYAVTPKVKKVSDNSANSESTGVSISGRMKYNLPLVVRVGDLNATVTLDVTTSDKQLITVKVNRTGNRSVYGRLDLIDLNTNKVIDKKVNISIYNTTSQMTFTLSNTLNSNNLAIRFYENSKLKNAVDTKKVIKL